MKEKQVVFRPQEQVLKQIQARINNEFTSEHQVANRDIERYYTLVTYALKEISLTEQEAMYIVASTNGTMFEPLTIRLLWANLEDSMLLDKLHLNYDIDVIRLIEKIKNASVGYQFSLADAIERWWMITDEIDNSEKLKQVGLL
jgi:hypothetical protein